MSDHYLRILTRDGSLRATAALTSGTVAAICRLQGTDPTASIALGRLVTGAALLASQLKGEERLALMIEGNGPLQRLQAEGDAAGHLRGTVRVPQCGQPPRDGRFDVAGAIGRAGFLHVVRDLGLKEPYRGMVQLASSEVGEDLAWYLTASEQIPSGVALGVLLDAQGEVAAAGGVLVQAMPNADPAQLEELERRLAAFPPVSQQLAQGLTPADLLARLFADIPYSEQARQSLVFRCSCSRSQAVRILNALGSEELAQLQAAGEGTAVTCEYCKEVYRFSPAEVAGLAGAAGS